MTATHAAPIAATTSLRTLYKAFLRSQIKPWRLFWLFVLSMSAVPLALLTNDSTRNAVDLVAQYSVALILPIVAVLVATSLLSNLIDDNLLVYLWMKPIPKWHIAAAAWAVTFTALIPIVVVPSVLAAIVSTAGSSLISATLIASLLGAAAYGAIFIAISSQFSRALWIGLMYVLVWENLIAGFSDGTARLSVRSYLFSYISDATDLSLSQANRAGWAQIVIPLAITVAGIAVAGWRLARRDVA